MLQGFSVVDHSGLIEVGCKLPQGGGPVVHFNLLGAQGAWSNHQSNRHIMTYPEQTLPATRISKHFLLDEAAITRLSLDMGAISRSQDSAVQPLLKLCLRTDPWGSKHDWNIKKTNTSRNTLLGKSVPCGPMQPKHDWQKPGVACVAAPTFLTLSRRKFAGDTEPSTTSHRPAAKVALRCCSLGQHQHLSKEV